MSKKKKGIDISVWQGNIDAGQVKNSGIDFVIIREGYRQAVDSKFFDNVKKCREVGLAIMGVYHFSYALNTEQAEQEAHQTVANLEKAGLSKDTIVFFDFEYDTVTKAAASGVTLGKAECNAHTKAFCETVESLGYRAGVYFNIDYYRNWYDHALLDQYVKWLADWTGDADYPCDFHQYTSKGSVPGISGDVDMNYYFFDESSDVVTAETAVKIGHASISENRTINGTKGDQTSKEVCIRDFYSKPWDFAAIHPDINVREKHAKAVEDGCANDNIGYGQGDRNTLNTEAKKVGYDLSKITTPCNTDCSEFQNVCAVASGAPGVTHASNGWTTSTMKAALQAAGYRIINDPAYLQSADYCVRGAIYVKTGSHTVCGLSNGSKADQMLLKAGFSGTSGTPTSGISLKTGDVVSFTGTKHYTSSNGTNAKTCKPGKAKVTAIAAGAKHPYHLIHTDSTSNVYGWVDAVDIGETPTESTVSAKTHMVVKGDTLSAIAGKYGTTVAKILEANKGKYPKITANYIVIGWTLSIPQ